MTARTAAAVARRDAAIEELAAKYTPVELCAAIFFLCEDDDDMAEAVDVFLADYRDQHGEASD